MKSLLVVASAPYGTDRVYTALRLASALSKLGPVRIFLLCDAVLAGVEGQSSVDVDANLGGRIRDLIECGAEVKVCGLCAETRGLHHAKLVPGIGMGSMVELADWTSDADRVISF